MGKNCILKYDKIIYLENNMASDQKQKTANKRNLSTPPEIIIKNNSKQKSIKKSKCSNKS